MNTSQKTSTPLYKFIQVIWYILYILELVLLFRFILKLIGAHTSANFTTFVYSISHPLIVPFQYVIGSSTVGNGVFEWSTLVAMFVYWIIAIILVQFVFVVRPVSHQEAEKRLNQQEEQ